MWPPENDTLRTQHCFCVISAKNVQLEFNKKEIPVKPKLKDTFQNNWPIVMKITKRQG